MRTPSLLPNGALAGALILAFTATLPARAEEAPPLPTCTPTVPVPPPEPPARPEGLAAERPPNAPLAEPPLPPARPAELSSAPAAGQDISAPGQPGANIAAKAEPAHDPIAAAPLPPVRPSELPSAPVPRSDPALAPSLDLPSCTPTLEAPLPPDRPVDLSPNPVTPAIAPANEAPLPPARPADLSGEEALKLTVAPQEDAECLRSLDALGVKYTKLAPIVNGQCSVANPLTVSALGAGIAIGAPETMVCKLAEGLMRWTAQVQQIAEKELDDTLKALTLGGTYVCRGQNHGTEAQLSEHSFANAVDVMGFAFGKRAPITVGPLPEGSKEAAFLAAVRSKACESFTTVLGPGTDEQHANHLHLDERERKAGYRLCQ